MLQLETLHAYSSHVTYKKHHVILIAESSRRAYLARYGKTIIMQRKKVSSTAMD